MFAAGSTATAPYTVSLTDTISLSGLTIEEGTITQAGVGTLAFGGTFSAPINIASNSKWTQSSTSAITGTDGIVKSGSGTLVLNGVNTFSRIGTGNQAYLTIEGGVVEFTADANLGAIPSATNNGAALSLNGGTLRYTGVATFALAANRGVNIGANGGTIEVKNGAILALPAVTAGTPAAATVMTGSGTLTKTGVGRLRLQTVQTSFTGKYVVKGGSLNFANQDRLGAIPAATQADYFLLDGGGLYGDQPTGASLDAKRGITLGAAGGYLAFFGTGLSYDGLISGTQGGTLLLTANDDHSSNLAGTISLNSANTYNGPTAIDIGMTLSVGLLANGGVSSAIGMSSNVAANLIFDGGTLLYRGAATSTDRSFTLTSAGGIIDASGANNAALNFTSTAPIGVTGTGSRILILKGTSTGDNTMSPAIIDMGASPTTVNKIEAGTWVLKNTANSYTGNTIISTGGRLKLGASGVIPNASLVQLFSSSFFDLNGFDETVRSVSGTSGTIALGTKSLTLNNPNGEVYSAAITGAGGGRIIKNGTGKFTLSPSSAAYDGGVTLNAGTLVLGTNTALGTGTFVVNDSATLSATSSTTVFPLNPVTLAGDLTFDDSQSGATGAVIWGASGNHWTMSGGDRTITVNSAPGGFGARIDQPIDQDLVGLSLIKKGNGTLTLNGANTYTGNTIIWDGTVSINQAYMADWAGVFLTSAAKLDLNFAPGVIDTVNALFIDGVFQPNGTWGAIGSGADYQSSLFTGTGLLNVIPYEPPITTHPLPGDFNNDGKVDNSDYVTWRKNNGANIALPNDNGLGAPIGQAHYDLWRQSYGNIPTGSGSGSGGLVGGTIPEPSSILLVLIASAGMSATFRGRRH